MTPKAAGLCGVTLYSGVTLQREKSTAGRAHGGGGQKRELPPEEDKDAGSRYRFRAVTLYVRVAN